MSVLPRARLPPTEETIGEITLRGESLQIPSRVYFPELPETPAALQTHPQRIILACVYTRHSDGFVRQKHARGLLDANTPWVVPFVVQLLGEYVVQIVEMLAAADELLRQPHYAEFLAENPKFYELTRQRAISYWDCYYRSRFPRKDDYPALRLLQALRGQGSATTLLRA